MKTLLLAAALLLVPAAASAQVAAGTVPNTFDRPAQGKPAQAAPAQAAPAQAPAAPAAAEPLSMTRADATSEETLRDFIAAVQGDEIDYDIFTDDLAGKLREQSAQVTPLIKGFGAVQAVDFVGARDGVDLYAVTFATAETEWMIGFNEAGKVAAILFRPAQAAAATGS